MLLLPETVTLAEARDTLRMLAQAAPGQPGAELVVDAAGLQRFDTSAIAVLLECRRIAQADGRTFELRNVPPKLRDLASLYGVEGLLPGLPDLPHSTDGANAATTLKENRR